MPVESGDDENPREVWVMLIAILGSPKKRTSAFCGASRKALKKLPNRQKRPTDKRDIRRNGFSIAGKLLFGNIRGLCY